MPKIRTWLLVVLILVILFFVIFGLDFYFLSRLNAQEKRILEIKQTNKYNDLDFLFFNKNNSDTNVNFLFNISRKVENLRPVFLNQNPRYFFIRHRLAKSFTPNGYDDIEEVWRLANSWPVDNEVYPRDAGTSMGQIIKAMQDGEIIKAYNSQRGTQLKIVLRLEGGQQVLWKPGWYARDVVIQGPVYSGKDRHNSEIIAFYLGAVLDMRWTPIAAGRKLNMKEIYEKADPQLKEAMIIKDNQYCVYGKCFYCNISELVCGDQNEHLAEGVILYLIPGALLKHNSPWQRTYKAQKTAAWETDPNYCAPVRKKTVTTRLLDIIDIAIFDYLIQNGDRHRHESRNGRLLILDNGKGFGNPYIDHIDILAPLYQCCIIRKTTYARLLLFTGGALTDTLKNLTKFDHLHPLLTEEHYASMEKRLLNIFATIEICIEKYGRNIFK